MNTRILYCLRKCVSVKLEFIKVKATGIKGLLSFVVGFGERIRWVLTVAGSYCILNKGLTSRYKMSFVDFFLENVL